MATTSERTAAFNAERRQQTRRLARLQRDAIGEIERQLKDAAAEIERMLASAGSDWQRSHLRALQAEIAQALEIWRTQAGEAASGALRRSWTAGGELLTQPLAAGGVSFTPRLNLGALAALEKGLTAKITGIGTAAINRINTEIAQVLIGTRSAPEAITKVQRWLGGATRRRARGIVYDELGRAYSTASQNSLSQATSLLPGLKKQWLHSGKRTPRPEHLAAHGQIVSANDPFVVGGEALMFPRDPEGSAGNIINCGCMSVPVVDGSTWTQLDEDGEEVRRGVLRMDPMDALGHVELEIDDGERIPLPG